MIIVVAILILFVAHITGAEASLQENNLTYWMEAIMLAAFGVSWLLKGKALRRENV